MMISCIRALCGFLVVAGGLLAWSGQSLALFCLEEEAAPLTELALAELSDDPELVLLERSEMEKIQQELLLSSSAGEETPLPWLMQNAGLFVVVRAKAMQAFDGRTGVRLLDVPVESGGDLAEAVRLAAKKQREFQGESLRRISSLPAIAANLSAEQSERARALEELLLRRLTNLPGSVLLERRHLLLLLGEPNAAVEELTRELFAGSVVMKTSIAPAEGGGVRLTLAFYTPDGRRLLKTQEETVGTELEIEAAVKEIMTRFSLPEIQEEDKKGEAQRFIYEAWFAVHQGLEEEAIAAASSAGALDAEYEAELCRIASVAAQRALALRASPSASAIRRGLLNLQTALDASSRCGVFPLELRQAFQTLFRYSPRNFRRCLAGQEKQARALAGRGIAAFMEQMQPPGDEEGEEDEAAALTRLSGRVFEMASFVQVDWDVSYWEQFTLPVLLDFIERSNRLLAEGYGNGEILFRTISASLVRFQPDAMSREAYGVYERTFKAMAASRILHYAVIGRFGLFRLAMEENSITDALNHHKDIGTQQDAFYADLLRFFDEKLLCDRPDTLPSLVQSCLLGDPGHVQWKLRLQEAAMERFHCPNLLGEHIVYGYETWSEDTARVVYDKLDAWKKLQESEGARQQLSRCQEALARRFHLQTEGGPAARALVSDMSFSKALHPFEKLPGHWNLTVLGDEDGGIVMMGNRSHEDGMTYTQLLQVNPETGAVRTLQEYKGAWGDVCGNGLFGCITATHYIAIDGYMLYLFPRNLDTRIEIVDLSQYGKTCCHSAVLADNRIFFSFDGDFEKPGNLVEYDLQKRKAKVIASTIDQSVLWPMQGYEHPYAIAKVMADERSKRLLMLLHDKDKDQYRMQFNVRLWAYCWDTGEWKALSEYLPTLWQDCSQGVDTKGRFWLSCDSGIGPLNDKGRWQPVVVFDNKGIADEIQPRPMFEGYGRLRVDYSRHLKPVEGQPVIRADRWGFRMLSERYFISREYLFDSETRHFYRLPFELREPVLVDGRCLIAFPQDEPYSEKLMLFDLKDAVKP